MNTIKRVSKNIASLFTIEVINQISLLILAIAIPRYLGDVGLGEYSFVISFTALFSILLDLGLRSLTIREVSRNENIAKEYFGNIAAIKLILSIITLAFIFIIASKMNYSWNIRIALYLMYISLILNSFSDLFRSIFYAFEKMEYGTLTITLAKITATLLALTFLFFGYGIIEVVLAFLIGQIFAFLLNYIIYTKKFFSFNIFLDLRFCKKLLKRSLPFGLAILFNNIFFNFDIVIITQIIGPAAAGWYSIPRYILSVIITFFYAISFAILPTLSKLYGTSGELLKRTYEKIFRFLLIIVLPLTFIIYILSDKIILSFFSDKFANSVFILKILIWLLVPITLARFLEVVLASINKQELVTYTLGICSLLNVALDIILVPTMGYMGAVISVMVAQICVFLIDFYFVSKYLCKLSIHEFSLKALIASIMVGGFVYYFKNINLLILVFVALILYYIIFMCMKGFDKDDWGLFKKLIKRE